MAKKSVDLTTLSGWANLSGGNHTIKIVAKGTGYSDSEKSAGVEVFKGYTDCLTFTGIDSEFTLTATNTQWRGKLEWSTDHINWSEFRKVLGKPVTIQSLDKKLYLRGKNNNQGFYRDYEGVEFVLSAKAYCKGNIQTLIDWENPPSIIPTSNCYQNMFYGCTNLISAPELPATSLNPNCYQSMFGGCTNLISAPELPATTLSNYCYYFMFSGCTKLKVNSVSGNKIFDCPSTIPTDAVTNMFRNTGGEFTGTPTAGNTYYYTV